MKAQIALLLLLVSLMSSSKDGFGQVAKAPPLPPEPESPAAALAGVSAAEDTAQRAYADALGDSYTLQASAGPGGRAASAGTLLIPKESADSKALAETEQDLNIMAHILDKAASQRQKKTDHAMGIILHGPFGPAASARNIYLEGYGALFLLDVNFPLVPPPAKEEATQPREETSSEWEDAKRELYQPGKGWELNTKLWALDLARQGLAQNIGGAAEDYDADKVETLKKDLIGALKNAAHIRRLKPDETLTVVVTGRGAIPAPKVLTRKSSSGSGGGGGARGGSTTSVIRVAGVHSGAAKLIFRAKKSDIDAVQKEKLTLEEFRKKVSVLVVSG